MHKNIAFLKTLQILNLAMIVGLLLFAGVAYYLISIGAFSARVLDLGAVKPYIYFIGGVFLFLGMNVGRAFFKTKMDEMPVSDLLADKLVNYRSTFIIRTALVEVPAIIIVVFSMLLSNPKMLIIVAFALIILIVRRPTLSNLVEDLKLSKEEQLLLEAQ